jgi:hypothetical protein
MKKILFIILIIASSCVKDKKHDLLYFLTNNNFKYWDLVYRSNFYDQSKSIIYPRYCYCFDKNRKWTFYTYKKGVRQYYDSGDIVIPEKWTLISDTLIVLGYKKYTIKKITIDTLIYTCGKADSTVLTRSKVN